MHFKKQYAQIKRIAKSIFDHPELGYKEVHTKQTVIDFLKATNPNIQIETFGITGLKTTLGKDKPLTIGFIAELDAVYAPSHRWADKTTGAAHNCGHYTQVAIALALYNYFYETKVYEAYDYAISFIFVPAEEYLDLRYRDQLLARGEISYYGGKPEGMKLGVFDDIDVGICVHAIGGEVTGRVVEANCDLAGFLYKRVTFIGKAAHAGADPFSGKNAYNMSTLFNVALSLGRQQLDEKEKVRMNPIVMESDMSTNVIPNRVTIGTDLRTQSVGYLKQMASRLDAAARGSALALQGEVSIDTRMGYLPFVQNRYFSQFVIEAFNQNDEIESLLNNNAISAAGDIGDLSFMIPCFQIGYSGFSGSIHGDDFIDADPEFIYEIFPRFVAQVFAGFNGRIDKTKLYRRSFDEYQELIASIVDEK